MGKRPAFTLAGIPVAIQPLFFAVVLLLGLVYLATPVYLVTWVVIVTVSILLHEFGHAIAFRLYGLKPRVALVGFGGVTTADSEDTGAGEFTPLRHIVVSLAGPLSALFVLGLPALFVAEANGYDPWTSLSLAPTRALDPAEVILGQLVYINVGWSVLNLLPVLPLDGGNVVAAVFEIFAKDKGRRIANVVSIAIAVVVAIWAMSLGYMLAPIAALFLVGMNVSELTRVRSDDADRELGEALRSIIAYDPGRAEQLARRVASSGPAPAKVAWAIELTAWARLAQGDPATAHQLVVTMPSGGSPSASIRGALALASGRTAEGVTTLAWAFVHDEVVGAKALGALAVAQTGQVDAVVHELLLMGPAGVSAAGSLKDLLAYCGHTADAHRVDQLLAGAAHRPA